MSKKRPIPITRAELKAIGDRIVLESRKQGLSDDLIKNKLIQLSKDYIVSDYLLSDIDEQNQRQTGQSTQQTEQPIQQEQPLYDLKGNMPNNATSPDVVQVQNTLPTYKQVKIKEAQDDLEKGNIDTEQFGKIVNDINFDNTPLTDEEKLQQFNYVVQKGAINKDIDGNTYDYSINNPSVAYSLKKSLLFEKEKEVNNALKLNETKRAKELYQDLKKQSNILTDLSVGDNKVDEIYGDVEKYGIDKRSLNGYLNHKDTYVEAIKNLDIEKHDDGDRQIGIESVKYKGLVNALSDEIADLKKKREIAYRLEENNDVAFYDKRINEIVKGIKKYKQDNLQALTKAEQEASIRQAKQYRDLKQSPFTSGAKELYLTINGELGIGALHGIEDPAATLFDLVGLDGIAERIRLHKEGDIIDNQDLQFYGIVSNKKKVINGVTYGLTEDGRILDLDTKKDITGILDKLGLDYNDLAEQLKDGEQNRDYSVTGIAYQGSNMMGNLLVQVLATRGIGGVVGGSAKAMLTTTTAVQSGLVFGQTYEQTLKTLRDAGISEDKAKDGATQVAGLTALATAVTSPTISPNLSSVNSFETNTLKEFVLKGVDKGKFSISKALKSPLAKEMLGEQAQELFENTAQGFAEQQVNTKLQENVLQGGMSTDDVITTLVLTPLAVLGTHIAGKGKSKAEHKLKSWLTDKDVNVNEKIEVYQQLSNDVGKTKEVVKTLTDLKQITKEQGEKLIESVTNFKEHQDRMPSDVPIENAIEMTQVLAEKKKLQKEKERLDPEFHNEVDEKLKTVSEKIQSLRKPKVETTTETQTETETKKVVEKPDNTDFQAIDDIINKGLNAEVETTEQTETKKVVETETKKPEIEKTDEVLPETETKETEQETVNEVFRPEHTYETKNDTYIVSKDDEGNLKVTSKYSKKEVKGKTRQNAIDDYVKKVNFDAGKRTDLSVIGETVTDEQVAQEVATQSENPLEIAQEIKRQKQLQSETEQAKLDSKKGAIATALADTQVNKESFIHADDKNNLPDVNRHYFVKTNKNDTGKNGKGATIDEIREKAQQYTNEEVTFDDITSFMKEHRNPKKYVKESTNKSEITDLELKFENLTGIKADEKTINAIVEKHTPKTETLSSDDIPFQTKSKSKTTLVGKALKDLVGRLNKTGLAERVRYLSESEMAKKLQELTGVKLQADKELQQIKEKAIADGTFMKAPNGKDTNLNEKQWLQVRTENFKNWFGDWENNPKEASKVVDENGEPLVVYHGTQADKFNVFNKYSYFTNNKQIAEKYSKQLQPDGVERKENIFEVFLNVKNIKELGMFSLTEDVIKELKKRNVNGVIAPMGNSGYYEIIIDNPNQIKSATENTGVFSSYNNDIRYQKELGLKGVTLTPYGFVHEGVVYLNTDKVKPDTPIHEFGHLWLEHVKKNNLEVFEKGIELIENTKYYKDVESNEAYSNLDKRGKLEEALAQAIGERGAKIVEESKKKKFAKWFKDLFTKIAKGLRLRNMSGEELADMTVEEYVKLASAELLSGERIVEHKTKFEPEYDISQIEVIQAEQNAIAKTEQKLRSDFKDKRTSIKNIKKELVDYINEALKSKHNGYINKNELSKLETLIKNAETKQQLEKAKAKVDDVVLTIEQRRAIHRQEMSDIKQQIKDKKKQSKELATTLSAYIKGMMNSARINEQGKKEFKDIIDTLNKTHLDKADLFKLAEKVDAIVNDIDNRIFAKKIVGIVEKARHKNQSGKAIGRTVGYEYAKVFDKAKEILSEHKRTKVKGEIDGRDYKLEYFEQKQDRYNELLEKPDKTNDEEIEMEALKIALPVLQVESHKRIDREIRRLKKLSKDSPFYVQLIDEYEQKKNRIINENAEEIEKAYNEIKEYYDTGRLELAEIKAKEKAEKEEFVKSMSDDVDKKTLSENEIKYRKKTEPLTQDQLEKKHNTVKNIIRRAIFNVYSGKFTGSMESIMSLISRSEGINRNSSALVQAVNKLKRQEIAKKVQIQHVRDSRVLAKQEIYGSVPNAHRSLGKRILFELSSGAKIKYTKAELLNLWMFAKNTKLLPGIENIGIGEKELKKIDDILTAKDKKYADFLFDTYEELYQRDNEVYKKINHVDLPKEDFYAGRVIREGFKVDEVSLKDRPSRYGTVDSKSHKERTKSEKPIVPKDVDYLLDLAIEENAHYVAFAESYKMWKHLLNSAEFKRALEINNKGLGKSIHDILSFYIQTDLENVKTNNGNKFMNWLFGNMITSTLGSKAKIFITQTISAFNGWADMPPLSPQQHIRYILDFKGNYEAWKYAKEHSDYLKTRYNKTDIRNLELAMNEVSLFKFKNADLEANRMQLAKYWNLVQKVFMANIKYGDMIGVYGALPQINAYTDHYVKKGYKYDVARKKALKEFESNVDRTQQGITKFSKTWLQKHPTWKYLTTFLSAPIQNHQNALYHETQLWRALKKEHYKGSNVRNLLAVLNYRFAQPALYTYIAQMFAGSFGVFGSGDKEPDDNDKELVASILLGNANAVPIAGNFMNILAKEALLDMDKSFAFELGIPLVDARRKLFKSFENIGNAKTKRVYYKNIGDASTQLAGLLLQLPEQITDNLYDKFVTNDIYGNDDVVTEVKVMRALGWSRWKIRQALKDRMTREEAERKKQRADKKFERSKIHGKTPKEFLRPSHQRYFNPF